MPAAIAWATLKVALAWWIVATAARMAAGSLAAYPPWALALVVALSARVLLSDVAHGNVNIVVAALAVAAARDFQRGRAIRAGAWAGVAAAFKVTPALFALYFAWKKSPRALAGFALGVGASALALPSLALGFGPTCELTAAWWRQMVEPYLSGAPLTIVQTEHVNQSYLGVLARWASESIAIRARPPEFPDPVSIHVLALARGELRVALAALAAVTLAFAAWCARTPRPERSSARTLGEAALVMLAMLFLSERSWKHHYVTLPLPLAFLAWHAWTHSPGRRAAMAGLAVAAVAFGLTGAGVLGDRASDLAEAYGAYLAGGLALFVACGACLRARTQ